MLPPQLSANLAPPMRTYKSPVKGSDIKEFKQTVLYAHCLRTPYKNELLNYYGKEKCTKKTIQKVQEIFESRQVLITSYYFVNDYSLWLHSQEVND